MQTMRFYFNCFNLSALSIFLRILKVPNKLCNGELCFIRVDLKTFHIPYIFIALDSNNQNVLKITSIHRFHAIIIIYEFR